ncbi:MAG: TonB-dependent receptor [Bacteroidota bacterium]
MRIILPVLFWLFPGVMMAQSALLSGKITHEGAAVEFAKIKLPGAAIGTLSDASGEFQLQIPAAGTYSVRISLLGFETQTRELVIEAGQEINWEIALTEAEIFTEEVVISGTQKSVTRMESPVLVEVFRPEFFRKNPTPNIFDALQHINGVRPQLNCNVCNTGDIHINGLEGPYTMVLLDGMPIVSGLSTVYGLSGIPNSLVERIEVVKGPASSLYGSEAVGGLINIITQSPQKADKLSIDAFATDWQEFNTDIGGSFQVGKKWHSLIGTNYFRYMNPIDRNGDGFTDITQQHRISLFNKWTMKRPQQRIASFAARYFYEDRWGGQMNWTPAFRGGDSIYAESIFTERLEAVGAYQLPIREKVLLQFSANRHRQNSVYGDMPFIADQRIGFAQLKWDKSLGRHELLGGAAYRYTYYDDNTPATAEANNLEENKADQVHLPGLFLQDEISLTNEQNLLLGLRWDHDSRHGNIWTPRMAWKWAPTQHRVFRFNTGTGFRVVNLFTEDHAALTGARSVEIREALNPEQSYHGSLNWEERFFTREVYLRMDASLWYTHFTNKIQPDYDTDPNLIIYENLDGYAISQGVSVNLEASFSFPLRFSLGATLMDVAQFTEENGETLKERQILTERFTGVWNLSYTFPWRMTLDYTGNIYGPMRLPLLGELDPRPEMSPFWSLQNLQLTQPLGEDWEIYGGVKNLLNFTPSADAIARAFDPFDRGVSFDNEGQAIPTANNPFALTFDPSYVYAPNQGRRGFIGVRYRLK